MTLVNSACGSPSSIRIQFAPKSVGYPKIGTIVIGLVPGAAEICFAVFEGRELDAGNHGPFEHVGRSDVGPVSPPSRVMWTSPSSEPAQSVPLDRGDSTSE